MGCSWADLLNHEILAEEMDNDCVARVDWEKSAAPQRSSVPGPGKAKLSLIFAHLQIS
jgi:hypothetical protein